MGEDNKIQLFENQPIRTAWNEELEEWYFSIIDVVAVLTESKDANAYWRKLKQRLIKEGNETVTNCHALKMKAADGKRRLTDVANTEQLLRIIQSIPSKKAEPFKLWLAQVGRDRIEEIIDPELTIDRALETYAKKGYPADWINQRLQTIRARKELTDEWQSHGVQKGKGDKERRVYFDAKAKVHLKEYIAERHDNNKALFVTLDAPHDRLKISGVELRLRRLGRKLELERIHPHKFRRSMATRAIDKGMPIEQVQKILGHSQIDTTMQYAMVNQTNVKTSHQKYMS